jgi:hypothetical protein
VRDGLRPCARRAWDTRSWRASLASLRKQLATPEDKEALVSGAGRWREDNKGAYRGRGQVAMAMPPGRAVRRSATDVCSASLTFELSCPRRQAL